MQILREGRTPAGISAAWQRWKASHPRPKSLDFIPNRLGGEKATLLLRAIERAASWNMISPATVLDPEPPESQASSTWKANRTKHRRVRRQAMFLALQSGVDVEDVAASFGCSIADALEAYKIAVDDPSICEVVGKQASALGEHAVAERCTYLAKEKRGRRDAQILRKSIERQRRRETHEADQAWLEKQRRAQIFNARLKAKWSAVWEQEMDRGSWDSRTESHEDQIIARLDAHKALGLLRDDERRAVLAFMAGHTEFDAAYEAAIASLREILAGDDIPAQRFAQDGPKGFPTQPGHEHHFRPIRFTDVHPREEPVQMLCSCGTPKPEFSLDAFRRRWNGTGRWYTGPTDALRELRLWRKAQRERLYAEQRGICALCRKFVRWPDASIDHIATRAEGGLNEPSNLQMTHAFCNALRGAVPMATWRGEAGYKPRRVRRKMRRSGR